jgi:glycosyltransferase involved in cell wall biosynthesis
VLIVAEASIPQCLKYRVLQRQEAFRAIGVDCVWKSWTDMVSCRAALQTRTHLILYRVPAHPPVLALVEEARRLGVPVAWECDDLVFDRATLMASRALERLPRRTVRALLKGADLYRIALRACDLGIASTPELADAMRRAGARSTHVIENCLDHQTLRAAASLDPRHASRGSDSLIRIAYGSGTNTHDVDFEVAAPAIARLLDRYPDVRMRIIGPLALPPELARHERAIERFAATGFEHYLALLAECDISIAPLEDFVFNDCKSSIKYLEASVLRLPSVCSARPAFARAISHGGTGFLCGSETDWESSLGALLADATLRDRIGAAAYAHVRDLFDMDRVAREQVAPLLGTPPRRSGPRLLSVNVFYPPQSFGGATRVAERMNRLLQERHGFSVDVFTTVPATAALPYSITRYEVDGLSVFGMGLSDGAHETDSGFESAEAARCFGEVLDATRPDAVHFHSIQGIGVGATDACRARGIPYVVTLHDAWWLCERQFMITRDGRYCGQSRIDPSVCAACIDHPARNVERMRQSRGALAGAALLLAPSQFFADLHAANGYSHVTVNRNGIARPDGRPRTRREGPVRYGYVGGNTPIKGFHLVRDVFRALGHCDAELIVVDNTMNLGFRSFSKESLRGIPRVNVHPAYSTHTMDEFFAGIDVLLFPTQWKESFGLTVREAIARDVWVIATDAGGVAEDIRPGINGTVIPFGDDGSALKEAVLDAMERFRRIPTGTAIRLDASGIRDEDEQAQELAGMLRSLVDPNPARRSSTQSAPASADRFTGPLIVCGMHRSYTSLMASILEDAGVHMGNELLEASDANPRGHFEDVSVLEFHQKALIAQGIAPEGYTTQAHIPISNALRREAEALVGRRHSTQCAWGWKEPRTTLFLDFWRSLLPNACFLLLFRRPWEVVDSLFRRCETAFQVNPMLAIDVWVRYNEAVLEFAQQHPSRCVVREATQVADAPDAVLDSLRNAFCLPLLNASRRLDTSLLRVSGGAHHAARLNAARPDAHQLYLALRDLAQSRSPLPSLDLPKSGCGGSIEGMLIAWEQSARQRARGTTALTLCSAARDAC